MTNVSFGLADIHKVNERADEVHHYMPYELNMKGIDFPVSLSKLNQFEKQNETFSINVFGYDSNEIYPLRITRQKGRKYHINLLYIQKGNSSHYCLMRNLNGFLHRTKNLFLSLLFKWVYSRGSNDES